MIPITPILLTREMIEDDKFMTELMAAHERYYNNVYKLNMGLALSPVIGLIVGFLLFLFKIS